MARGSKSLQVIFVRPEEVFSRETLICWLYSKLLVVQIDGAKPTLIRDRYETACARRQPTSKSSQAVYIKQSSRPSVLRMEVWWRMITEVNSNDNSVESGELRHSSL